MSFHERAEMPNAHCSVEGDSAQFDQCFRPFFNHFPARKLCRIEFTDTSSAGKTARKIAEILRPFGLLTEI